MKYIPMTQGLTAIVDDEDYENLSKYKWQPNNLGYVKTGVKGKRMHQFILDIPDGMEVDHINLNKLDNRKENLRLCTRQENNWNTNKRKDSPNKYKGVHFIKGRNKWLCRIQVSGVRYSSKHFKTEEEAAKHYDELAIKHFGSFAKLNFPIT